MSVILHTTRGNSTQHLNPMRLRHSLSTSTSTPPPPPRSTFISTPSHQAHDREIPTIYSHDNMEFNTCLPHPAHSNITYILVHTYIHIFIHIYIHTRPSILKLANLHKQLIIRAYTLRQQPQQQLTQSSCRHACNSA
jgi:hypothetical protein